MTRLPTLAAVVGLLLAAPIAQQAPEASPRARLDALFEAWVTPDGPGGAYGVVRGAELVHSRGFGLADVAHGVPFEPGTPSYLGSVAKQFTALAVLLLADAGELSLGDELRQHVPELADGGPPIRIHHLLHHTSGLRDYLVLAQWAGVRPLEDELTREQALALVFRQRQRNFDPGARFEYCNTGYLLLALIVERASGTSFGDFVRARILEPLGMTTSTFSGPDAVPVKGAALGYRRLDDGTFVLGADRWFKLGAGGLHASVEELAYWVGNFGDPRVGDAELLAVMTTPPVFTDGTRGEEGAGLVPDSYRGLRVVHHAGNARGYGAEILRFPDQDLGLIVLCNVGRRVANPTNLALRMADVLLEDLLDPLDPEPSAPDAAPSSAPSSATGPAPEAVAGVYAGRNRGTFFQIWREPPAVLGRYGSGTPFSLLPLGPDALRIADSDESLTFVLDEAREAIGLEYRSRPGAEPSHYERVPPLTADESRRVTGRYTSDELGVDWQVQVADGRLDVSLPGPPPRLLFADLTRIGPWTFTDLDETVFEFDPRDSGAVEGLTVSDPRVHALRFVRR